MYHIVNLVTTRKTLIKQSILTVSLHNWQHAKDIEKSVADMHPLNSSQVW